MGSRSSERPHAIRIIDIQNWREQSEAEDDFWIRIGGWDDEPLDDAWNKWVLGVVVPSLLALFGASKLIWPHAVLWGRRRMSLTLTGWDAVAFGICWIGVALFLHAHYHWSLSNRLAEYADLGRAIGIMVGVLAFGFVLVRNVTLI